MMREVVMLTDIHPEHIYRVSQTKRHETDNAEMAAFDIQITTTTEIEADEDDTTSADGMYPELFPLVDLQSNRVEMSAIELTRADDKVSHEPGCVLRHHQDYRGRCQAVDGVPGKDLITKALERQTNCVSFSISTLLTEWIVGETFDKSVEHRRPASNENCHYDHDNEQQKTLVRLGRSHVHSQSLKNGRKKYTNITTSRKRLVMKSVNCLLPFIVLIGTVKACAEPARMDSRSEFQRTLSRSNLNERMEDHAKNCAVYGPSFKNGSINCSKHSSSISYTLYHAQTCIRYIIGVHRNDSLMNDNNAANHSSFVRRRLLTMHEAANFDISANVLVDLPLNAAGVDTIHAIFPGEWRPASKFISYGAVCVIYCSGELRSITYVKSSNLAQIYQMLNVLNNFLRDYGPSLDLECMNLASDRHTRYPCHVCSCRFRLFRDNQSTSSNHMHPFTNSRGQFAEQTKHLQLPTAITDFCQRLRELATMVTVGAIHVNTQVEQCLNSKTVYRNHKKDKTAEIYRLVNIVDRRLGANTTRTCPMLNMTGRPGHSSVQHADGNHKILWKNTAQVKFYHTRPHGHLSILLQFVMLVMLHAFVILAYLSWSGTTHGTCKMEDLDFDKILHTFDKSKDIPVGKWYLDYRSDTFPPICQNPIYVYPIFGVRSHEDFFRELVPGSPPLKGQEDMKFEWARLKSFISWPDWAPGFPSQIASAGFYYTDDVDKVVCFSCGGAILDWTPNMVPMDEHKIRFPYCKFVLGQNSDNRSVPERTPITSSSDPFFILKDPMPTGSSSDSSSSVNPTTELRVRANDICGGYSTITSVSVSDSGYVSTPPSHLTAVDSAQPSSFVERMKVESSRRTTFRSWPKPEAVSVLDLVMAGFYYTGNRDEVKCAFCGVVLGHFQRGDNPMTKHRSLFPACPFVRGIDSSDLEFYPRSRAILEAGSNERVSRLEPQGEQSQLVSELENLSILDDIHQLGLHSAKPKHPDFAVLKSRVASFQTWSSAYEQTPRDLAVAGFIYAGMEDCVKCFYCGGGLRNWLPLDLPWVEHARWFSNCLYVKLRKGQEFIDTVEQRYPRPPMGDASSISAVQGVQGAAATDTIGSLYNLLRTPAAQSAIDMGYSASFIKKGLRKYLHEHDGTVSALTAQSLMEILLEMEHNGEGESSPADKGDDALLIPDTKSLREKNRELVEQTLCKICLEKKMCITFLPCGHLVSCELCAPALRKCPICRSNIKGRVRVYMS